MSEETATKAVIIVPCAGCYKNNRVEITFNAKLVEAGPVEKKEEKPLEELENAGEKPVGKTESGELRPDREQGKPEQPNEVSVGKDSKKRTADTKTGK